MKPRYRNLAIIGLSAVLSGCSGYHSSKSLRVQYNFFKIDEEQPTIQEINVETIEEKVLDVPYGKLEIMDEK